MKHPKLTLTDAPTPAMRSAIVDPLVRFNEAQIGQPQGYRPLVILISDPVTETIFGGLWSATANAHLHIDLLFVPEELRRTGLGRRLIKDAEDEAVRRGCRGVWLDTYSFQARGFAASTSGSATRSSAQSTTIRPGHHVLLAALLMQAHPTEAALGEVVLDLSCRGRRSPGRRYRP